MPTEPLRRAFPDTSVLYPVSLLDLVLSLAEARVHSVVLSEDLLDELDRKWTEHRRAGRSAPPGEGSARSAFDGIRRTFGDHIVARTDYADDVDGMPGNDEDDKPHIAAARAGGATHIITSDRQGGFPPMQIARFGISVQGPDEYLAELLAQFPEDVVRVVENMAEKRSRRRPHITVEYLLAGWRKQGLTRFCDALEHYME